MLGVLVERVTGPASLVVTEIREPDPSGLVIDVHAAGVGFPDLLMTRGDFQVRQQIPFTLGWEAAGVVRHAPNGSRFAPGDRVAALAFGAYAEQVSATEGLTMPIPISMSFEEAAAFPLNHLTAYAGLKRRGRLQPGENVLVHGAAGGVGTAAVQVAKALGARVIAVVSDEEKTSVARRAGADEVLLLTPGWRDHAVELSDGGVDLVFDPVGGDRFPDSLRCLASEGRLVVIGFAGGTIPSVTVNRLLLRNIDIVGCSWSVLAQDPDGVASASAELTGWAERNQIRPLVGRRFDLVDVASALHCVERREAHGKTVLLVR